MGTSEHEQTTWRTTTFLLVALVVTLSPGLVGCSQKATPHVEAKPDTVERYARGRWRLGSPVELDRVLLFVSHILIRHDELTDPRTAFSAAPWDAVPGPNRSRREALRLANELSSRARSEPRTFASLAHKYSDDVTTRDHGGSLGGVQASKFLLWPEVLDCLAAIGPGEASRVVETPFGFHVFLRRPPPTETTVAFRRIVIGHRGAPWLRKTGRVGDATRTRDEAASLARQLAERARKAPESFPALVREYSEHREASDGDGDQGVWSSHEPTHLGRHIELLTPVTLGEVVGPLETNLGFEVFQRTAAETRPRYAMTAIKLGFHPDAPAGDPSSKEVIFALAASLSRELARHPERMKELQIKYCCAGTEEWTGGRGPHNFTAVLEALSVGAIAASPVESDGYFGIPMRLEPRNEPRAATLFEIPRPSRLDLRYLVENLGGGAPAFERLTEDMRKGGLQELRLEGHELAAFSGIHRDLSDALAQAVDGAERLTVLTGALDRVKQLLGETRFASYSAAACLSIERRILQEGGAPQ